MSTIEAVSARGLVMGNRGCLHDEHRELRSQRWRTKSWIICRLSWKGERRQVMKPGSWTELFFLDEAVALAAGHRPCGYCRRDDYREFLSCWASGTGWNLRRSPRQPDIDVALHADRVDPQGGQRTHMTSLDDLPAGCFLRLPNESAPRLVSGGQLYAWSHAGYRTPVRRPMGVEVVVLTPAATVAALRAGYAPIIHPSAAQQP